MRTRKKSALWKTIMFIKTNNGICSICIVLPYLQLHLCTLWGFTYGPVLWLLLAIIIEGINVICTIAMIQRVREKKQGYIWLIIASFSTLLCPIMAITSLYIG